MINAWSGNHLNSCYRFYQLSANKPLNSCHNQTRKHSIPATCCNSHPYHLVRSGKRNQFWICRNLKCLGPPASKISTFPWNHKTQQECVDRKNPGVMMTNSAYDMHMVSPTTDQLTLVIPALWCEVCWYFGLPRQESWQESRVFCGTAEHGCNFLSDIPRRSDLDVQNASQLISEDVGPRMLTRRTK